MGRGWRRVQGYFVTNWQTSKSQQNNGGLETIPQKPQGSAKIKKLIFASLVITILANTGFSATKNKKDQIIFKKSENPQSIIIHKHTSNFIDIEAPIDKIWIGCTDIDPKENLAFMAFYVLDGEQSWEFHYRRVLNIALCSEDEREYKSIIKKAKTVRLVGIITSPEEAGPEPKNEHIPERFTNVKKITSSIFVRLEANGRCKSYFSHHCDLPKNYWGGTTPE